MLEALTEAVRNKARPFFGICVGMQLMATHGKEHVTTDGFNWIAGDVEKITPREEGPEDPALWDGTRSTWSASTRCWSACRSARKGRARPISCIPTISGQRTRADVLARAPDYGGPSHGHRRPRHRDRQPQFHPEKSQRFGLALISNFFEMERP